MEDTVTEDPLGPRLKKVVLKPHNKPSITEHYVILQPGAYYINLIRADGTVLSYTRESVEFMELLPMDEPELDD